MLAGRRTTQGEARRRIWLQIADAERHWTAQEKNRDSRIYAPGLQWTRVRRLLRATATLPFSPGDLPPHSFSVAISRSGVASPAMIPTRRAFSGSPRSQSPRSPSGQSFLSVSVTDPVKLGTGVQAYISYRVITKCYTVLIDTTDTPSSIYRAPSRHFQENPFVLPFPLLDPFPAASKKPHPTLDIPHSDPTQQSHSPTSPKAARLLDSHQQPQIQCHFHSRESSLTLPSVGPTSLADNTYFTNIPEYQGQEKIVIRRYSDFVWLRNRLADKFKGIFIPPLPEKSAVVFLIPVSPPPSLLRPFILNPRYFSFHATCSFCPARSLKPLSLFIFFAWTRNQIARSCLPPEICKLDVTIVVSPAGLSLLRPLLPTVPAEAFQSTTLPLQIALLHRRSSSLLPSPCNHKSRRQPSRIRLHSRASILLQSRRPPLYNRSTVSPSPCTPFARHFLCRGTKREASGHVIDLCLNRY
ncbi:Sorting nexin 1 [Platanthera guangdongensis]|uniref:Sorting nexin 1 n=1 Tax=Platanthera guangdongensis TaxID=2320717 RepID=A0ABR2MA37_9ASPA